MNSSFGARRKPRKVGQDLEDSQDVDTAPGGLSNDDQGNDFSPIRPQITFKGASKSKKRSSLRISFGPDGTSMTEDDDTTSSAVFTPKKSNLSRQAAEKNALRKALAASLSSEHLPIRQTDERPIYSKDHLSELRSSTPSTPQNLQPLSDADDGPIKALDIAAKFGTNLAVYQDSAIPTDAEIKEKKERRARLAKEEEYINLYESDDENDNEISLPHKQKPETRLVHDDEEIAEGFDEFVEDSKIPLGRKAEQEQKLRYKAEMRDLINEAEGSLNDDSDESEAERRAAYEAAQTRSGLDGLEKNGTTENSSKRDRTPPRITPLPNLSSCLERLQVNLSAIQYSRAQKVKQMEELNKEKIDIAARETEIQTLLKEAGENYEKLRAEAGIPAESPAHQDGRKFIGEASSERGLENMRNTPITDRMGP